jgi:hypothetical protein
MAALVVARDIAEGRAEPLPNAIERDSYGLPIVIWAPAPLSAPLPAPQSVPLAMRS